MAGRKNSGTTERGGWIRFLEGKISARIQLRPTSPFQKELKEVNNVPQNAMFLSARQVRKYFMKSRIHNSLKEMRELGARLTEIERIRYRLRKENAPKEAFQDLDRLHLVELALDKKLFRKFVWSAVLTLFLIYVGLTNGVIAMIYFRAEGGNSVIGIWNALCSFLLLYIGKREIIG